MANEKVFLSDIESIRARARRHIEEGAVTENYGADKETVIRLLNEALATEIARTASPSASFSSADNRISLPTGWQRAATRSTWREPP